MSTTLTVAAPPTVTDVTSQTLASMAALSGVVTDYNEGSQVRTFSEANGAVIEQQGVWSQAQAFQAAVYGALAAFNISPYTGNPASGQVTFATAIGSGAPPVNVNVGIPSGTIVQTAGAIQFLTSAAATLVSGATSVNVNVLAAQAGAAGNVPPGAVSQIVNGLSYPLVVYNVSGTAGGADAETPSQTLARFSAERNSIPAATPNAIANAVIGVTVSGTGESVAYSTVYEPWVTMGSGVVGYTVFLDNGFGTASSGLISAVETALFSTPQNVYGYRPCGVPYAVSAVTPTYAVVDVSGTVSSLGTVGAVTGAASQAISGYFSLPFGTAAEQGQIAAATSNAALGLWTSLTVSLYVSGSGSPVTGVVPPVTGRVLLGALNFYVSGGT